MKSFDLILCDLHGPLITAWQSAFAPYAEVQVIHGSLIDVAADAYVSPANSFGIMDGGFDAVLSARFPRVQDNVQEAISALGEPLAVGECLIVETGDQDVPYIACTPTMLFPTAVANTDNAFQAMRAVLSEVEKFNSSQKRIRSLAVPGLCTGIGRMPPETAAEQMAKAYQAWRSQARI